MKKRINMNRVRKTGFPILSRKGTVIVLVITGLVVTAMICGSMIRQTVTNEKQSHLEDHRVQSLWLAEAGIERAAWNLKKDPSYKGETWKLSKEEMGQNDAGEVEIKISEDSQSENNRRLTVTATYPVGSRYRAVQTKTIPYSLNQSTP